MLNKEFSSAVAGTHERTNATNIPNVTAWIKSHGGRCKRIIRVCSLNLVLEQQASGLRGSALCAREICVSMTIITGSRLEIILDKCVCVSHYFNARCCFCSTEYRRGVCVCSKGKMEKICSNNVRAAYHVQIDAKSEPYVARLRTLSCTLCEV